MKRIHVKIFGNVQGVGFRHYTQHRARKIGVNGWVKNNIDGSVEAVFEGDDGNVDDMIELCERGPSGAHVEHVNILIESFRNEFEDFSIL